MIDPNPTVADGLSPAQAAGKTSMRYIQSPDGGLLTIPADQLLQWEARGWVRISRAEYRDARRSKRPRGRDS